VTSTHFLHNYVHRKTCSCKWASNSKPCDHESDTLSFSTLI